MTTAEEYKAKGNAALQSKKFSDAIENYTAAINVDGSNHVYYSNRSAAYLSQGDGESALNDANSCLGLNPEFVKGYSRKGAALHSLKRYNDSVTAYEEGIAKYPDDKGLKSGLEQVNKEKDIGSSPFSGTAGPGGGLGGLPGMSNLFGPDMMTKIALDPKLRGYMSDPEFMEKIQLLQKDPNQLSSMMSDPRIMEVFQVMLGMGSGGFGEDKDENAPTASSPATFTAKKDEQDNKPEPMEVEEEFDFSDLSPQECKKKEDKVASLQAKLRGNDLYKSKKFDEALAAYDEAIALDPTNMTFLSNKAAVFFTTKKYDDCVDACNIAVEVGKENRAPFLDRAKALTRCAKAYQKKGDLPNAIESCKSAQLESYEKTTERFQKTLELEQRKAATLAYQDEDKAEEEKQKGNNHFRNKEFSEAVSAYENAVKRSPKNATIRNNLASALCKIMDFNGAKKQIETALDLDPKYTKAWGKKGDIEFLMKENHKAMDSYKKGLEIDPTNKMCREGLAKVTTSINYGQANMTDEEKKERAAHAMADPEIQNILQDPIINQVLKDFQENPTAANEALRDPSVKAKIERLIASGVVQTG